MRSLVTKVRTMTITNRGPQKGMLLSVRLLSAISLPYTALQWANPTDSTPKVQNPTKPRSLRIAGVNDVNHVAGKTSVQNDMVTMSWTREAFLQVRGIEAQNAASVTVQQGDPLHVANVAGEFEPYVLGTGTTQVVGFSREKYVNAQTTGVPLVAMLAPHIVAQPIEVRGFIRTITANNTRYAGVDATELTADEVLFEAPWDGKLQGPLRVSVETTGVPDGQIDVTVRIKVPGGSWADAQINSHPWTVSLALSPTVTSASDATLQAKYGGSLDVVAGTKVAIKVVKNDAVANVAQLSARLAFV